MISLDTFTKSLERGEITKLNFTYESKEYLIVREDDGEAPAFAFASEDQEAVRFATARKLVEGITVGGENLQSVWRFVVPICADTLLDDDYIGTVYGDSLGKIMCSAEGTTSLHERYLTQYCIPSIIVGLTVLLALMICTFFVPNLTWTVFGIVAGVIAAALVIAQVIFISHTKRYRHGNPIAHCYLLSRGAVIITDRYEYAIPYEKISRLSTEAGIQIVTLKTVFSFIPDHGEELTESLKSIYEETKSIKRFFRKKKKKS